MSNGWWHLNLCQAQRNGHKSRVTLWDVSKEKVPRMSSFNICTMSLNFIYIVVCVFTYLLYQPGMRLVSQENVENSNVHI